MVENNFRKTWITVNLNAIESNLNYIKKKNPNKKIMVVLKANAYGHGDLVLAHFLSKRQIDGIAVSSLDEAIHLRQSNIQCPILVLGYTEPIHVKEAIKFNISLTVTHLNWLRAVEKHEFEAYHPLKLHLKLNTGMNRLGTSSIDELKELVHSIHQHPKWVLEGAFTHYATADGDPNFFEQQHRFFEFLIHELNLPNDVLIHEANSATSLYHAHETQYGVRAGLGLYGIHPIESIRDKKLKPALSLYSQLTQVRWLNDGEYVGYGISYQASKGHWIGVIPIGYADGWWRQNQGRMIIIKGFPCEIIGRVCMDQLMVKLPKKFLEGTQVCLIGKEMPIEVVASELNTISYEILCSLSDRIPRVYVYNGSHVATDARRFKKTTL